MTTTCPPILIFRSPTVPILVFAPLAQGNPYVKYAEGLITGSADTALNSVASFETVGAGGGPLMCHLKMNDAHTQATFPGAGEYYSICQIGCFKALVLKPQLMLQDALDVLTFVARNSVHSDCDMWLGRPHDGISDYAYGFDGTRLAEKFFYSDQPLFLQCGDIARFLSAILLNMGFMIRYVRIYHPAGDGHLAIEVQDPNTLRWVWLDADFGAYVTDPAGLPLGVSEIQKVVHDPGKWIVVDVGRKCWIKNEFNPYIPFMGQVSWSRDKMTGVSCTAHYREILADYMWHADYYVHTRSPTNPWRLLGGDIVTSHSEVPTLVAGPAPMVAPREPEFAAANQARALAGL